MKTTSSKETIQCLGSTFDLFDNPSELVSDRGTAFSSYEFANFVRDRNISHHLIAVAVPWANGIVERVNRFLKSSLRKVMEDLANWPDKVGDIQYVINNTFHSSIKASSSKLLLGYDKRNHLDLSLVRFLNNLAKSTLVAQNLEETEIVT
ncbi:Pro-Pol polyprotein [Trachymyrmex zeteki]|uniref:Pro-Pol polyprotein n=1 Tax=Mycetomoellerius zeteki TaxID=64791 RepID=A0A151XF08_9HYME|nr:Pro-Pol polyprotein [Trachymyrmex zeteki]